MSYKDIKVGDTWVDELGNKFIVKDIQGTVIISESISEIKEEEK